MVSKRNEPKPVKVPAPVVWIRPRRLVTLKKPKYTFSESEISDNGLFYLNYFFQIKFENLRILFY